MSLRGDGIKNRSCLWCGFSDDNRHIGLDDTGLLESNLFERGTQELRMVHPDVGDDRQDRGDDIGAVESATQPHFDDGDVHILVCKILEGHGCGHLEEGGLEGFDE